LQLAEIERLVDPGDVETDAAATVYVPGALQPPPETESSATKVYGDPPMLIAFPRRLKRCRGYC
jgi:hypothetical protein